MVTIKHIAQETGFSFKTVSRALNGEKGVSPQTAGKILQTAKKMGYVANPLASSLKSGRTGLIAILTGPLSLGIKAEKLYAIQGELEKSGRKSLLSCTSLSPDTLKDMLPPLLSLTEALVILQPNGDKILFEYLGTIEKPVVIVDGFCPDIPSLVIDRERGVWEALTLLHRDYDRFIYMNAMPGQEGDGRYRGFSRFTAALGPEKQSRIINTGGSSFAEGYGKAIEMIPLLSHDKRTLILCTNDQMAFGVMKALYERQIDVPGKVGVIGFDGDSYGPFGYKSLSTIKQPVGEVGLMTVEILENILRGTAMRKEYTLATTFVRGESV